MSWHAVRADTLEPGDRIGAHTDADGRPWEYHDRPATVDAVYHHHTDTPSYRRAPAGQVQVMLGDLAYVNLPADTLVDVHRCEVAS